MKSSVINSPPHVIINQLLPTINEVKLLLEDIRYPYFSSCGNQVLFLSKIRQINPLYPLIINILLGVPYPITTIITFSYWDRLVANIIISWCSYSKKEIHISNLFQFIDIINGDSVSKVG